MLLLDHLLQIEKIDSREDREAYAEGLYLTNRKFAQLCDLAYRRSMIQRYEKLNQLPKYKQDNIGYGLHISQLEKVYNKLKVAGFTEHGNDKSLPEKIARNKLIQIFESLSDIENQFIKYVLMKDIPWFNRELWKRAKHS